jgi:TolB-like protein/DNA-binding SARP family transcriptional activator
MLHLRTLGRLELESADGRSIIQVLSQPRRLALFVYLAAARPRGPHQRDALLPLFWAEADEASARHALSQALYWLRERLGEDFFETTNRDAVGFRADAVACDVVAFDAAVAAGRWSEALDLYRGDFLAGFHAMEARAFNDWMEQEQRRLRQQAARAAWALATEQANRGAIPEARASARRAARLAPTAESSLREFLTTLAEAGCRADAVAFYEEWSRRLEREYELSPSAETRTVVADLRRMEEGRKPESVPPTPSKPKSPAPGDIAAIPTPAGPFNRRRFVAGAAAVLVTVLLGGTWWMGQRQSSPPIRSLAVLPLNNLMGDSAQDYFVDGMHEALTAELSKIGALKVISRTSAMRYRDTDKGIPQIARELGVAGIIEGSVLREGDRVRITVQLIDGVSDQHIWGDSYERELRDILSLQGEVAQAIAGLIRVRLTEAEEARLADAPSVDPGAYEDYLKGLREWSKFTVPGWEAAIGNFQKSVERAPSFAPAHAMMSFAYSWLGYYSRTAPALLQSGGLNAAERAVALDSSLPEAHASLALVKTTFDWDWSAADRASREALRLNPNSALALLSRGFFLSWVGRHDEAISVGKRAVELDPVAPYPNTWLAWIYFMARRYDDAIAQVSRVLALEPDYADAQVVLMWVYAKKGMFDQALAARRRHAELVPEESRGGPRGWWADAWILALAGRANEARSILDQVPADQAARPMGALSLAQVYGELGEPDRAFALLDVAYQTRPGRMSVLKVDPRFDALRDDPRFDDLLRRMNFPD